MENKNFNARDFTRVMDNAFDYLKTFHKFNQEDVYREYSESIVQFYKEIRPKINSLSLPNRVNCIGQIKGGNCGEMADITAMYLFRSLKNATCFIIKKLVADIDHAFVHLAVLVDGKAECRRIDFWAMDYKTITEDDFKNDDYSAKWGNIKIEYKIDWTHTIPDASGIEDISKHFVLKKNTQKFNGPLPRGVYKAADSTSMFESIKIAHLTELFKDLKISG